MWPDQQGSSGKNDRQSDAPKDLKDPLHPTHSKNLVFYLLSPLRDLARR